MIGRIRTILNKEDISASKLAEKMQIQRSSISHILSERNKPSLDFVTKLLDVFPNINPEWVLNGKGGYLKNTPSTSITNTPQKNITTSESTHLFQDNKNTLFSDIKKGIKKTTTKIVTFYSDGTFDEYTPNN